MTEIQVVKNDMIEFSDSSQSSLSCAIITPVGPGHVDTFETMCLPSIKLAIENDAGPFNQIDCIPIYDVDGSMGRSKARNVGVKQANSAGYEWVFFLDADDILYDEAFSSVNTLVNRFDAIWGPIVETSFKNLENAKVRNNQIALIDSYETLISHDPFLTLQMGHFVKTSIAVQHPFDEDMDTGEDFKYYIEIWKNNNCVKSNHPLFVNVRGNHSVGPRSANGAAWRSAVEAQLELAKADFKNPLELTRDFFQKYHGKIAMVVAHPDDETLWAGGLLNRLEPIDIICCSIPRRDPERAICFFEAVKKMGHFPILLPFIESSPTEPLTNLEHLDLSQYQLVITHGENGEYGHLHHKQIHKWINKSFDGSKLYFGFGKGNLKVSMSDQESAEKISNLKCYDKISPFDAGKPKWLALLDKYDIDKMYEYFFNPSSNSPTAVSEPEKLSETTLTEEDIRKRADYQNFVIADGVITELQGRMKTKLDAVRSFLPPNWKNKTVLDIGCDFGFWSFLAATNGAIVTGLDRSRKVRGVGHVNIPKLNNIAAKRNNVNAKFFDFEVGQNWKVWGKHNFVYCMSLYHHIFNVCGDHQAIWYWLWQNTMDELVWENPTEIDDTVVQMNLRKTLFPHYNESVIRQAAEKYFVITSEQPALHETTRIVWHCVPKESSFPTYRGKMKVGAGGAAKAFRFSSERRCKEFEKATGYYPVPGSLNIELETDFDWNAGYYIANLYDVQNRRESLNQNWIQKRARIYPVKVADQLAWVFRFEADTHYPKNFVELISHIHLRTHLNGEETISITKI
jgi:SAM-dependent methyltransferase